MLRPVFGAQEGAGLSPGVFSELRFDRHLLRPSAAGAPIAEHRDNAWQVDGRSFPRMDCTGRVFVYVTDKAGGLGRVFGPFAQLSTVDGVMLADRQPFATFDEAAKLWQIEGIELRSAVLVARIAD